MRRRARCARRAPLIVCAGLAVAGCASGRAAVPYSAPIDAAVTGAPSRGVADDGAAAFGAPSAGSAVAGFLDGARARDYAAMARLFGTERGPASRRWGRAETEQRMLVLAGLLSHGAYRLRPPAAGEEGGRARWVADLAGTRRGDVSVPFIVVPHRGRWFVEQILTEGLAGSSPSRSGWGGRDTGLGDGGRLRPRTPP